MTTRRTPRACSRPIIGFALTRGMSASPSRPTLSPSRATITTVWPSPCNRASSLSGAARNPRINHSTVFRRSSAFEATLGVRWFERLRNGYALTSAGEEALHIVERIETDVVTLDRTVTGQDLRLSGVVRITAIDMFAFWLLPDHLARFRVLYPGIEIEAVACNETLNLSRRETDIALRVGNIPPETLVGRRVGRLNSAI
jgi:DNA-binding transcriptional LysR family regulator